MKEGLIYKDGRSKMCFVASGQVFCGRHRRRSMAKTGEISCLTVAVGDFSELGGGHIDMLFERGVEG